MNKYEVGSWSNHRMAVHKALIRATNLCLHGSCNSYQALINTFTSSYLLSIAIKFEIIITNCTVKISKFAFAVSSMNTVVLHSQRMWLESTQFWAQHTGTTQITIILKYIHCTICMHRHSFVLYRSPYVYSSTFLW